MTKKMTIVGVIVALIITFVPTIKVSASTITVRQVAKMSKDVDMEDYVDDSLPVTVGKGHSIKPDVEKAYIFSKIVNTKKGVFLVWDFLNTDIEVIKSSETTAYSEMEEMIEVNIDQNTSKGIKKWFVIYDESQGMTPWYVESEDGTTYEARKVGKNCWKLTKE